MRCLGMRGLDGMSTGNSTCQCEQAPHRPRQEATAPEARLVRGRIVAGLQIGPIPTLHEFDGVRWTDSAARLAEGTITAARREIRFDGVKRTDLEALIAVNAT
jgi:hypothetical protein